MLCINKYILNNTIRIHFIKYFLLNFVPPFPKSLPWSLLLFVTLDDVSKQCSEDPDGEMVVLGQVDQKCSAWS